MPYLAIAAIFAGTSVLPDRALDALPKTALLTMLIVVIHLAWLAVGASVARILRDPLSSRVVNVCLALTLLAAAAMTLLG